MIGLKILSSPQQLAAELAKYLETEFPKILLKSKNNILVRMRYFFREVITNTQEYQEMMAGNLRAELGIPDPEAAFGYLVDQLINRLDIQIDGNELNLLILREGYENISDAAIFNITELTVTEFNWLKWVLTEGDNIKIVGYDVQFGSYPNDRSRTGEAIMIRAKGDFWTLPREFGPYRVDDNFITRALSEESIGKLVDDIFREEITRAFK